MDIENHPIPQDITGFQFKLIGNMTLKQFAYLAGGFVVAWILYITPLFFFIKISLALLSAVFGASLAFVPIEGRPMDLMIMNFFKAIFKPTQYVYNQKGQGLEEKDIKKIQEFNKKRGTISDMSDDQIQQFLTTVPKVINKVDKKEMVFLQNVNQIQSGTKPQNLPSFVEQHAYANITPSQPAQNLPPIPNAQPVPTAPLMPSAQESMANVIKLQDKPILQRPQQQIIPNEKNDPKQYQQAHQKVMELEQNLGDMLLQKQQLEEKLTALQKQMQNQKQKVYSPTMAAAQAQPQQTQFVRSVPQSLTKSVGLPTTPEYPNVVSGIVKDPRGNPLSNILVEVKDAQGNATRAFKTNALGQFASATALTNGDYTIEFEDPRGTNKFDVVGFKANGEIILPIEVISVDTREELRRSLFN